MRAPFESCIYAFDHALKKKRPQFHRKHYDVQNRVARGLEIAQDESRTLLRLEQLFSGLCWQRCTRNSGALKNSHLALLLQTESR